MRKLLVAAAALAALAGAAGAEEIKDPMVFPAKNGKVVFYHLNHVNENGSECRICHQAPPGKIAGFDREYAHRVCFTCHSVPVTGSGASNCEECHGKR